MWRWLALGLLLAALFGATDAGAHAVLISVEPADGSRLARAPDSVQLRFNEVVTPGAIRLIDAAGTAHGEVTVHASDNVITIDVPPDLPNGTTLLSYRVISEDGHPVAGTISFAVGLATDTPTTGRAEVGLHLLIWLAKLAVYVGLLGGVGGAFCARWIAWPDRSAGILRGMLAIGLAGVALSPAFQGLDLLGLSPGDLSGQVWQAGLAGGFGRSLLLACAAMLAALVALQTMPATIGRLLSLAALAGVGLSLAATGHSATSSALARVSVGLHGIGVAFWVGALTPLGLLAASADGMLYVALRRFSTVALPVVTGVVATGAVLAIVQLERPAALVTTAFGLILAGKLLLVVMMLGLAALNRLLVLSGDDTGRAKVLTRTIGLEIVCAACIVALVAGWRFTPPPRALAAATPVAVHLMGDGAMVDILVVPVRPGIIDVKLRITRDGEQPLALKDAKLELSRPEQGIEAIERQAVLQDADWLVRSVPMQQAGHWHVRIEALVSDFEERVVEGDIELPAW